MQPVMFCILTVLETAVQEKLLQEQITVYSEAYVPVASVGGQAGTEGQPCAEGVSPQHCPHRHLNQSTWAAQYRPAAVLLRAGGIRGW